MLRRLVLLAASGLLLGSAPAPATAEVAVHTVLDDANFPTNLALAPDGRLFFTEKETGRIRVIEEGRLLAEPFATLPATPGGETGLLGIALDPRFPAEPWVYVYYSDSTDGRNRLVRIRAEGSRGAEQQTLLDALPTVNGYHNGGDLAFGADGMLYLATGEEHEADRAQDPSDLGGKILRLNPDGSIPPDNPLGPDNPVFALGIRNSFGLCVNPATGNLWETENGPDRDDEVNLIEAGANYGWPLQLGPGGAAQGFADPILVFPHVIVPTGCAFPAEGEPGRSMYFGDFGGNLHRVTLAPPDLRTAEGTEVVASLGDGITDVAADPHGGLLVATASSIVRVDGLTGVGLSPTASGDRAGGTTAAVWIGIAVALAASLAATILLPRRGRGG